MVTWGHMNLLLHKLWQPNFQGSRFRMMDPGLPSHYYYHKVLHLVCCSSPRSVSELIKRWLGKRKIQIYIQILTLKLWNLFGETYNNTWCDQILLSISQRFMTPSSCYFYICFIKFATWNLSCNRLLYLVHKICYMKSMS